MRTFLLTIGCAVGVLAGASVATAAEPVAAQQAQTLTRAQVLADLEMWDRAGMNRYPSEIAYPDVKGTADYQANLNEYHRLRSGPEFQAAVQQMQVKLGE